MDANCIRNIQSYNKSNKQKKLHLVGILKKLILAVYPYSIKRTSPVDVNKNKDTRIRKILLHWKLYKQAYGREFSRFHSRVF